MKYPLLALTALVFSVSGCAMFTAWKSIPPPGGCDQCHTQAISTNWQVSYQVVDIADERGRLAFQTPEHNQPVTGRPENPLEARKVEEKACFDCHKSPNQQHRERKGRFHH
ncbi:MAG: cytochrome C [Deltaproteobacteria bacterium]|nr:cytochrome C [Deltaproteobacteria bacterium]